MFVRRLFTLIGAASLALATSHQRDPILSIGRIEDPVIHTAGHRIGPLSHFDLDFLVPHIHRQVRLTLEPNNDVLADDASINHVNSDGQITKSEPIHRHHHKVYKGIARMQHVDGTWANVGQTRITVLRDGPDPLFDGMFSVMHDSHHILLSSSYARTKQLLDPEMPSSNDDYMVVFRDSDLGPALDGSGQQHTELKRDADDYMCRSGLLPQNQRRDTGLLPRAETEQWGFTPVTNLFGKRQIDTIPGSGNTGAVDLAATIGQTSGCPSTRRVALVGVATDCGFAQQFNSTQTMRQNVISAMNSASGAFEAAFNISLGLQNLTVMDASCPGTPASSTVWNQACSSSYTILDRLNDFSAWRNTLPGDNSHWTLMTSCNDGPAVGLAWVGTACTPGDTGASMTQGNETVAGANVVALTAGTEWQVLAHETGHTFGAVHDCDSQTCADTQFVASGQCCPLSSNTCDANSRYIMNPYTVTGVNSFSACTVGNICSAIGRNSVSTSCLTVNRDVTTITGQECGNGIVEEGEECDCGDAQSCADDNCCDGATCKFKNGAVCDDANEGCCSGCQFASKGTVCRPSSSSCDPAEYCPGTSSTCPPDVTAPDGQACNLTDTPTNAGQLTCASGQCTSRNLQCITVMASYTDGSNDTYACDDTTCVMSCGSPAFGPNVCYSMQQNLLDGTACGGGGHCVNGQCQGSSTAKEIENWIDEHKGIVIGIAVAVGLLILVLIIGCCCGCFRRRKMSKMMASTPPNGPPMGPNVGGWYGPPPPPLLSMPQQEQHQHQHYSPTSPSYSGTPTDYHQQQTRGDVSPWGPYTPVSPADSSSHVWPPPQGAAAGATAGVGPGPGVGAAAPTFYPNNSLDVGPAWRPPLSRSQSQPGGGSGGPLYGNGILGRRSKTPNTGIRPTSEWHGPIPESHTGSGSGSGAGAGGRVNPPPAVYLNGPSMRYA